MTDRESTQAKRLLEGYVRECEMAQARGVGVRALRTERQRGDGPPWLRIGGAIFYPEAGFREWLKAIEQRPARARKAA